MPDGQATAKRAWIPKADGRQRPLGIAALEDKIVQHAVKTVLEQIYEADFLGFSYGIGNHRPLCRRFRHGFSIASFPRRTKMERRVRRVLRNSSSR